MLLCIAVLPLGSACVDAPHSELADDESLQFFRTGAWLDEANQEWHVPIHGWIYEPQDSTVRKKLFRTVLKKRYDLDPSAQTEANFTRRLNLMIADNERGKRIVVTVAGRDYALPDSGPNGHFATTLKIPAADVGKHADDGVLRYSAVTRDGDTRSFSGEVLLVEPTGLSIISDIDDTVKISDVSDRRSLLENTFLLDFRAVPGMAPLYREWSETGVSVHFVSSSPWQLYAPLEEWLDASGFPRSPMTLKSVRFRDETLFNLFKDGTETKPEAIEPILRRYSGRKFVLVGDSGEQDPEVYSALMRKYPDQVLGVYIRNVTGESARGARLASVFEGIDPDRWRLFEDPRTLTLPTEKPGR